MPFAADCIEMPRTCLNQVQTWSVDQDTTGESEFTVLDKATGLPVDLTPYSGSSSSSESSSDTADKQGVELIVKELPSSSTTYLKKMLEITDAVGGKVKTTFTVHELRQGGAYVGALALWAHGDRKRNIPIFFDIEYTMEDVQRKGPLSVAEVRFAIRDLCPQANFLLDEQEFTTSEVVWAIRRPIEQWNETPPPVRRFTPANFPYRYHWLEGVIAELLMIAVSLAQRNDLGYAAGGTSIDDQRRRWQNYLPMAQARRARWEEWMKAKKIEINVRGGFSQLDSGVYGWEYWWV